MNMASFRCKRWYMKEIRELKIRNFFENNFVTLEDADACEAL